MSIENDDAVLCHEAMTFGLVYENKPEEFYLDKSEREPRIGDAILLDDGREGRIENIGGGYLFLGNNNSESDTASDSETSQVLIDANYKIKLPCTTYPVLDLVDQVVGTESKPSQILIQGENLHALKLLTFAYAKKIDCIYIDPPYNTGSTGWRYNNNYVNPKDAYRHSKWLSFMEHRLKLAKQLLNPKNSVLICAIGEDEVHRLGLLLEQVFPDARIQMISLNTNAHDTRKQGFMRAGEYLFFVMLGEATPLRLEQSIDFKLSCKLKMGLYKDFKRDRSSAGFRTNRPNEFYPIFVKDGKVVGHGDPLPLDRHASDVEVPQGYTAILPILSDGAEGRWQNDGATLDKLIEEHRVRVKPRNKDDIEYIGGDTYENLKNVYGSLEELEVDPKNGSIVIDTKHPPKLPFVPADIWNVPLHNASDYGTKFVGKLLGKHRPFEFVKSLYAVEDAIRFFVADKPDALVLDFFAGSGTTGHAVMRLNKQDSGKRVCISVTNNENGICDEVTFPRLKAAITGKSPDGSAIEGSYKGRDESPIKEGFEENLEYFKLRYVAKEVAELGGELPGILPVLWMASRSKDLLTAEGIEECRKESYMLFDSFGLLTDYRFASEFADRTDGMKLIAISTFDDKRYQWLASRFSGICYQLPDAYLRSMEMNGEI